MALWWLLACVPRPVPPVTAPAPPAEVAPAEAAPADSTPATAEEALFGRIAVAYASADAPGALALLAEFDRQFPESRAGSVLVDWKNALERMGKAAPSLESVLWPGEPAAPRAATLIVFFEPWCPHCRADVPQVELLRREYEPRGLTVVGITAMSRGATEADLAEFVTAGQVGFPIGREDGSVSEAYGVAGVPHIAFVREGMLVWSGHPSLLTLDLVGAITEGRPLPIPVP